MKMSTCENILQSAEDPCVVIPCVFGISYIQSAEDTRDALDIIQRTETYEYGKRPMNMKRDL